MDDKNCSTQTNVEVINFNFNHSKFISLRKVKQMSFVNGVGKKKRVSLTYSDMEKC